MGISDKIEVAMIAINKKTTSEIKVTILQIMVVTIIEKIQFVKCVRTTSFFDTKTMVLLKNTIDDLLKKQNKIEVCSYPKRGLMVVG